jgi:hypothetical protein
MSAHTPGPWIVFNGDGSFGVLPAGRPGLIAECKNTHDARLIAAAPDMLEALHEHIRVVKIFMDKLGGFTPQDFADCTSQARRAIAKATGENEGRS